MDKEKKHNYEYAVDVEAQTAPSKVVRMVGGNKKVLEIGAGPGSITKLLQIHNHCDVTAIEIDPTAIKKLSEFCEEIYQCDLNSNNWTESLATCGKFDVIVAADVLEHLYTPHNTLVSMKSLLADDGYVVVSLPHVGNNAVIASILDADFEYHNFGLLDKTHIRFFGIKNMQNLFENAGYNIISAEFVITPPKHTELASHWNVLPRHVKEALSYNRFGTIYQVVIKATPASATGKSVQLIDLLVPKYPFSFKNMLKDWVRPYLSPEMRETIRRIFNK